MRDRSRGGWRTTLGLGLGMAVVATMTPRVAHAWLFHEHADVTQQALDSLTEAQAHQFAILWTQARPLIPGLCAKVETFGGEGDDGQCVGPATLPALAGDHSCDPSDLAATIGSEWGLEVVGHSNATRAQWATATHESRMDLWALEHLQLQLIDRKYLTRAAAGTAHFQLPRVTNDLPRHLSNVLSNGERTNATALYVSHHFAALMEAQWLAKDLAAGRDVSARARRVLLHEMFALHFLEDAFSAGHVVGAHPPNATFKGTHDHYSEFGISAHLWSDPGTTYHAHGDAFLGAEDRRRAAHAVRLSLAQVLAVSAGQLEPDAARSLRQLRSEGWGQSFDACGDTHVPSGLDLLSTSPLLHHVLAQSVVPVAESPLLPEMIDEIGAFVGTELGGTGELGYAGELARGQLFASVGAGFSAQAISTRRMDAEFHLNFVVAVGSGIDQGDESLGYGARLHMPWAYVPGDGLIWMLLYQLAPESWFSYPAIVSLAGPFQIARKMTLTRGATIQFALGRDATFLYYPRYQTSTGRAPHWDLRLPVLMVQLGRAHSAPLSGEGDADLSFTLGRTASHGGQPADWNAGVALTLRVGSRWYP